MINEMSRQRFRATFLFACVVVCAVSARESVATQSADAAFGTVLSVNVNRVDGSVSSGSAILLSVEKSDSGLYAVFSTCFHVLHKAKDFSIDHIAADKTTEIASSKQAFVHVRRKADVVIIKVPITEEIALQVKPCFKDGVPQLEDQSYFKWERGSKSIEGTAYGYSFLDRRTNVPVAVKIWGHESFGRLPAVNGETIVRNYESPYDRDPVASVAFLGNEITMPGMSGGLVLTNETQPRFAGMIFARIAGVQGLAVSAETVVDSYHDAQKKNGLRPFSADAVSEELPFNADLQSSSWKPYEESRVEWESFDQWMLAFRNDAEQATAFEKFQELRLDLRAVDLKNTEIVVGDPVLGSSEAETQNQSLRVHLERRCGRSGNSA